MCLEMTDLLVPAYFNLYSFTRYLLFIRLIHNSLFTTLHCTTKQRRLFQGENQPHDLQWQKQKIIITITTEKRTRDIFSFYFFIPCESTGIHSLVKIAFIWNSLPSEWACLLLSPGDASSAEEFHPIKKNSRVGPVMNPGDVVPPNPSFSRTYITAK